MNNSSQFHKSYDQDFYHKHIKGMAQSARALLQLLFQYYKPTSIVDIGCGQGAWLAVAERLGVKTLKGFDGDWVQQENLLSQNIDFSPVNFEEKMPELKQEYDLCLSLEVAEHISITQAAKFIELLCMASDTIVFGAAIPKQGGENHINEQWQSYWVSLFGNLGYECIDLFRGALWGNSKVEWWYRQNTFLFLGPDNTKLDRAQLKAAQKPIFDIIHPMNYLIKINPGN